MLSNLEYFKVFYYVAKTGSMTLAANELNISQPAVSQQIKQLESQMGVNLIERVARGVKLTAEGELLFEYVSKGIELMETGEEKVKKLKNLELGEIHIGASDMTLEFYLLRYLEKFHELYPDIKVMVTNAPTPETLNNLRDGKIDFGIVSSPVPDMKNVNIKKVREIEDVFVAGRRFISYKNKTLDLKELEKLPIVCLESNTSTRKYIDGFLAGNDVAFTPEFELSTSDMIVQFAERNLGVGNVVRDFAAGALEKGTLFELRFNKMIPKRHFCVVTNKDSAMNLAAEKLLRIMEAGEGDQKEVIG